MACCHTSSPRRGRCLRDCPRRSPKAAHRPPATPTPGSSTSSACCGRASKRAGGRAATSSTSPLTLTMSGVGWSRRRPGRSAVVGAGQQLPCRSRPRGRRPACFPSLPPAPGSPCRVRNYLRQEMASFLGLCEYTERADAARARSYFFDRRKRVGWARAGVQRPNMSLGRLRRRCVKCGRLMMVGLQWHALHVLRQARPVPWVL